MAMSRRERRGRRQRVRAGGVGAAGAARGPRSTDRRVRDAAHEPVHLRPRGDDRALRRDQSGRPPRPRRDRRRDRVGGAVLQLRAWLSRWRLDRELADGGDPHEPLLCARATKLTHPRVREAIASRLERAIAEAECAPRRRLSAAIPVRREAVREARPLMLSLAVALREPGPLSPQGIARAEILVSDGGSSLYWDGSSLYRDDRPGDLPADLRSATAALHMGRKLEDNG
jgi:hypothetical protein